MDPVVGIWHEVHGKDVLWLCASMRTSDLSEGIPSLPQVPVCESPGVARSSVYSLPQMEGFYSGP